MPRRGERGRDELPRRYLSADDVTACTPVNVLWELTLACDQKCVHCGSRAGKRRENELSTAECLDVIAQLAALGTREISLIGGEAYLRKDWLEIVRAIRDAGIDCSLHTGGRNLTEASIRAAAAAGLQGGGVSLDGLPELHDELRGVKGSYEAALRTLRWFAEHGIAPSVNTQINARVLPELRALMDVVIDAGAKNWQLGLTTAMGNAADHPELLLQPFQMLDLMPLLAALYREGAGRGLLLQPSNNIGYFGPYESFLRGTGDDRVHWSACSAGQNVLALEADGTLKGCPSLPRPYAGGNVRDRSIAELWRGDGALTFSRRRTVADLWGYCRGCYYAEACLAGCTWTTHVLFGRPGNNPYCHYRALQLAAQGLRERVVQVARAPGLPFDHGEFALVVEPLSAPTPAPPAGKGRRRSLPVMGG